jgi:hypothetical protein
VTENGLFRDYGSKEGFKPFQNHKKIFCLYPQDYKMFIYSFHNLLKKVISKLLTPEGQIKILRKDFEIICKEEVVIYFNVS